MLKSLKTNHGTLKLPAFFPDATKAVIRGTDSNDLKNAKVDGIVINVYHLMLHGMVNKIKGFGGAHKFMGWNGPMISDSGGFQVFSLIRNNPKLGTIRNDKVIFRIDGEKHILTPEKCIQIQLKLGSDIVMVLDDCTHSSEKREAQEESVKRTIDWAKKCKKEFEKLAKGKKNKPLLFAIVQGGVDKELRKYCAEELIKIGFDGYAFGGWPIDKKGNLLIDILKYTADLLPNNKPKYAMGIGKPENIIECVKLGYNLFDCVVPTREARHKKLYVFKKDPNKIDFMNEDVYGNVFLKDKYVSNKLAPISKYCDCHTCKNYSLAYLMHLFKVKDALSIRLATIHNLRFYSQLMDRLKKLNK
jgi:queuine tRNA-ribosyltransferase